MPVLLDEKAMLYSSVIRLLNYLKKIMVKNYLQCVGNLSTVKEEQVPLVDMYQ